MTHSKGKSAGREERRAALGRAFPQLGTIINKGRELRLPIEDILAATVACWSARRLAATRCRSLPAGVPSDATGLPLPMAIRSNLAGLVASLGRNATVSAHRREKSPFPVLLMCDNVLYHTLMKPVGDGSKDLIIARPDDLSPAPLFAPTRKAAQRFLEFFTAQTNNAHTRRAYLNATRRFADWCASKEMYELAQVQPFHVAAFVHDLQDELSPPSVKQHLAAIRMLFDWLVTGHVIETNPAHSVRGPRYTLKKGKTPVLTAEEAHALLESIPVAKKPVTDAETPDQPDLLGLRDRALLGIMVYSFARIGAVIQMKVGDYLVQGRRRWIRLHEKGGKEHDVPCHHRLDQYLHDYIEAAGIANDTDGYLFRTARRKTGQLTSNPLFQQDAHRIIRRRAKAAGIETRIGNHSFRATGITAYLKNSGKLEVAQQIANHESPRTTKLYDRRNDEISLDEIERILI